MADDGAAGLLLGQLIEERRRVGARRVEEWANRSEGEKSTSLRREQLRRLRERVDRGSGERELELEPK